MGVPKLWGKDSEGNKGFLFSHVKTIYYNWASKILLSTKLDEMDALIDAKIAKAMMSNQQVNSTDKVPTSALAYAMSQNITTNANAITAINGSFELIGIVKKATFGASDSVPLYFRFSNQNNGIYQLAVTENGGNFGKIDENGTWNGLWSFATKGDIDRLIKGSNYTAIEAVGANDIRARLQINADTLNATIYKNTGSGWNFVDQVATKGDLSNFISYKGQFSGDFNRTDIEFGVYFLSGGNSYTNGPNITPKPSYCVFVQFPAYRTQMIVAAKNIFVRKYTGDPASWSEWASFEGTFLAN